MKEDQEKERREGNTEGFLHKVLYIHCIYWEGEPHLFSVSFLTNVIHSVHYNSFHLVTLSSPDYI